MVEWTELVNDHLTNPHLAVVIGRIYRRSNSIPDQPMVTILLTLQLRIPAHHAECIEPESSTLSLNHQLAHPPPWQLGRCTFGFLVAIHLAAALNTLGNLLAVPLVSGGYPLGGRFNYPSATW